MFPTVYVVFTEKGFPQDVYADEDIAHRFAKAFSMQDKETYTVQAYSPHGTSFAFTWTAPDDV